jgi:hypothetical protein
MALKLKFPNTKNTIENNNRMKRLSESWVFFLDNIKEYQQQ